ncbi:hypothetical protein FGRMN_1899 [Fusarium graminum]|nr:hypothetical protein FGRMN_1899 [Fusarium graminum]
MAHFTLISGSMALFALSGVIAAPYRPSSSALATITTSGTTEIMSTKIGDTTTALATTTAETQPTEIFAVTTTATVKSGTEFATATSRLESDTTLGITRKATTATQDATTTPMAVATSGPIQPPGTSEDLPSLYAATDGTTLEIHCDSFPSFTLCLGISSQIPLGSVWKLAPEMATVLQPLEALLVDAI